MTSIYCGTSTPWYLILHPLSHSLCPCTSMFIYSIISILCNWLEEEAINIYVQSTILDTFEVETCLCTRRMHV